MDAGRCPTFAAATLLRCCGKAAESPIIQLKKDSFFPEISPPLFPHQNVARACASSLVPLFTKENFSSQIFLIFFEANYKPIA